VVGTLLRAGALGPLPKADLIVDDVTRCVTTPMIGGKKNTRKKTTRNHEYGLRRRRGGAPKPYGEPQGAPPVDGALGVYGVPDV